uniref:Uncharacterized protein n=1 Tax=Euplotes harpa TaxID=151035 RepID=A0A7S3N333_9SPIT|mmetsp:Transcript_15546/g.18024  ORF Transcript_15546/g.18024 Transcript_15546/m.18024 type:complete len:123 (+) Transcript_15546:12-380(+)
MEFNNEGTEDRVMTAESRFEVNDVLDDLSSEIVEKHVEAHQLNMTCSHQKCTNQSVVYCKNSGYNVCAGCMKFHQCSEVNHSKPVVIGRLHEDDYKTLGINIGYNVIPVAWTSQTINKKPTF